MCNRWSQKIQEESTFVPMILHASRHGGGQMVLFVLDLFPPPTESWSPQGFEDQSYMRA